MIKVKTLEALVREELTKVYPQLQINCRKVCGDGYDKWGHDLLHMCIEIFLEKKLVDQLYTIHIGKIEHFITNIMNRQLKLGKTTRFWHKHRKFTNSIREYYTDHFMYKEEDSFKKPFEDEVTDLMQCINIQINKLDPFQKMLIKEKVDLGYTYRDIENKYNIPYSALQGELKRVLKKIKQTCKHLR